jgi:hypothetical protein
MDKNRRSAGPLIIAIVLLLLPMLYVGSYLALKQVEYYCWGGDWASRLYWPLEQIDRKMRPEAWKSPLEKAAQ